MADDPGSTVPEHQAAVDRRPSAQEDRCRDLPPTDRRTDVRAPRLLSILDDMSRDDNDDRPPAPAIAGPVRGRRQVPIPEGARDNSLFRIAAGLVQDGARGADLLAALREANARLC